MSGEKLRPPGWTAREALACAYCWAEFAHPEGRTDTPEQYWLSVTERARNECRSIANARLLLAVARGQAVAVLPPEGLRAGDLQRLTSALNMKMEHRVRAILAAVFNTFKDSNSNAR